MNTAKRPLQCSSRAQRLMFINVIVFAPLFPPDSSALYFIYEALITGSHHSEVITVCVSNSCSPKTLHPKMTFRCLQ